LWTTTSAASTLMSATTKAYDREDRRGFVRERLRALVTALALRLGAALVLSLLVFGPHVERWVGGATGVPTLAAWTWWTLQWPLLVAGILFAFAVTLALGPDVDQRRWRLVTPGAVTALVLWLLASSAFAIYTSRFGSYAKSWGTISAVVVTLIWLWVTSAALLFGAEIDAEAQRSDARVQVSKRAACPASDPATQPRDGQRDHGTGHDERDYDPEQLGVREERHLEVHPHHSCHERPGKQNHGRKGEHLHDLVRGVPGPGDEDVERADDARPRVTCRLHRAVVLIEQAPEAISPLLVAESLELRLRQSEQRGPVRRQVTPEPARPSQRRDERLDVRLRPTASAHRPLVHSLEPRPHRVVR